MMGPTEATTAKQADEQAIRQLVERWLEASKAGDQETVLSLMSDDVVFMVPGMEPFGKEAFKASSPASSPSLVDGTSNILEIEVLGDWAWMRSHLSVTISTPGGETVKKAGYILTILRKNPDGQWVIARDANLLA